MSLLFKFLLWGVVTFSIAHAEEAQRIKPIPDPLTLNDALSFSYEPHTLLVNADLSIQKEKTLRREVEVETDLDIYLEGRLGYVQPSSLAVNQGNSDHRAGFVLSKTLYDFGRDEYALRSADFSIKAEELSRRRVILERRLDIMQKFFDVILADMRFYRYNEEMATEFVSLDKLRDQLEVGQVSDIQVMEKDVEYQRARYLRIKSQNSQRLTRAKLATAMGRSGELVTTISKPKLPGLKIKLPDVEVLNKIAFKKNIKLNVLMSKLAAAEAKVQLASKADSPTVSLEAANYAYTRNIRSRDEYQLGIVVRVPIFAGNKTDVETAKALHDVHQIKADIELLKDDIATSILDLWLEFDALKGKLQQMQTLTNYRELYLDRSRALYELEVKTDLGDAMVRVSEAERDFLKTQYDMVLVLTKIELEVGKTLAGIMKDKETAAEKNSGVNEQ
ncbi:hypothetical protein MNBD_GAMMA23-891 [hydrothermal vent metagenome]|uniref:Outer membrane efflux protein n=1 Tax=hydrothermal vent metagenome TaxID=652676 RepID=A0A3B0ZF57_9ZZZZ